MNSLLARFFCILLISAGIAFNAPLSNAAVHKVRHVQKSLVPLPAEKEWWLPATDNGRLLPVLTDPWWERISASTIRDRATDLWWRSFVSLPQSGPLSIERAQEVCAGAGGMRLPTRHEMESIVERYRSKPAIDSTIFPGIVSDFYWTRTPSSLDANWVVNLDDGKFVERNTDERNEAYFFCVSDFRRSPPSTRYAVSAQSVHDNASGLFWDKKVTSVLDFQSLADACLNATVANMQWRVPTIKELSTILSPERSAPYIDPVFAEDGPLSSSTAADGYGGLTFQGIDYATGYRLPLEGTSTRCVSGGEPHVDNAERIFKGNVEMLSDYENGNLRLQTFEATHSRSVEGNVLVQGLNSAALVLPYLETINGDLNIVDSQLEEIHLPHLQKVTGTLTISGNARLKKISMRSLTSIGKDFVVSKNIMLGSLQPDNDTGTGDSALRMESLSDVGGALKIEYNEQLKALYWPALQAIGNQFFITQNASMWWLQVRRLRSIGSHCRSTDNFCGTLDISVNPKLKALSLNFLEDVFGDINFQGNGAFEEFDNRLRKIGLGLYVESNKSLCAKIKIDSLLYRMWSNKEFPSAVRIDNNEPSEDCRTACPNLEGTNCAIQR